MKLIKSVNFLRKLAANNNREWFNSNRDLFIEAKEEFEIFIDSIINEIRKVDSSIESVLAKDCIFRIYKDVRFSKDKLPYKINFAAYISNGGRKGETAGYYIHIEPEASFIGGGIYMPNPQNLKLIRNGILDNIKEYKSILNNKEFKEYFGGIYGEKLKSAPRGFDKNYPDIEFVKNKHFAVVHNVNDDFWIEENIVNNIINILKVQKDFNLFLNNILE